MIDADADAQKGTSASLLQIAMFKKISVVYFRYSSRLNNEIIWKIQEKSKLNSEKFGKYRRNAS